VFPCQAHEGRDAPARPFDHVFSRATPRDPGKLGGPQGASRTRISAQE